MEEIYSRLHFFLSEEVVKKSKYTYARYSETLNKQTPMVCQRCLLNRAPEAKKTKSVPYFLGKFHDLMNLMTLYMIQMVQNGGSQS